MDLGIHTELLGSAGDPALLGFLLPKLAAGEKLAAFLFGRQFGALGLGVTNLVKKSPPLPHSFLETVFVLGQAMSQVQEKRLTVGLTSPFIRLGNYPVRDKEIWVFVQVLGRVRTPEGRVVGGEDRPLDMAIALAAVHTTIFFITRLVGGYGGLQGVAGFGTPGGGMDIRAVIVHPKVVSTGPTVKMDFYLVILDIDNSRNADQHRIPLVNHLQLHVALETKRRPGFEGPCRYGSGVTLLKVLVPAEYRR